MEHQITKTSNKEWTCRHCKWTWKSKPDTECPGVIRYDWQRWPNDCLMPSDLEKHNLKPKTEAIASGAYYSRKNGLWLWLYKECDCQIADPNLPEIVLWDEREERGLLTTRELQQQHLVPDPSKKADAVAWVWDREEECGKWITLYLVSSCTWKAKDECISKSVLKTTYLLSDGWIKRLGEPNKKVENRRSRSHPICLYSRQRVERFLADNAEEYAQWLNKRDKYLAIFEQNKDKIVEGQKRYKKSTNAVKDQTDRCLCCASGCATSQGFLCAIHPMGILDIPCPDWKWKERDQLP